MKKIKIFMAGGRRCGKTTVLTSLWSNADATLSGTDLSMVATDDNQVEKLQETYDLAESYFDDADMESFVRVSDDNANPERRDFYFSLQLAKKKTGIDIQFTDVPGEFFVKEEHFEEVKKEIRESHVIIVAIDTPCLMEDTDDRGYGKWHNKYNKPNHIIHFIKDQLNVEDIADRLILFVPIKCEKYYYRKEMRKVAEAVKNGYRELLDYIDKNLRENCAAAVLPILSLGGLEFFGFTGSGDSPTAIQEYIYHANQGTRARYLPMYCDQPLLYTIAYILKTSKSYRNGPIWALRNFFFNSVDGKTLRKELQPLVEKVNRNEDEGFVWLQNPMGL